MENNGKINPDGNRLTGIPMTQCNYISSFGPCEEQAHGSSKRCEEHAVNSTKLQINQYRIASSHLGDAPFRHSQGDQLKSLMGEIVILRSLLESRLNMIDNETELIAATPVLKDLAVAIEKLVASCHAMDVKLANLLSKQELMSLAQEIIGIIEQHLRLLVGQTPTDEEIDETIEAVGLDIVAAIASKEKSE